MLNWKENIGTVSTFSEGELSGTEVVYVFNGLRGMAVVDNFFESPRYDKGYINIIPP